MKLFFAALIFCFNIAVTYGAEKPFNLLVISSFNETLSWSEGFREGIVSGFKEHQNMSFYIEYLDSTASGAKFSNADRAALIAAKYAHVRFDAVIADSDAAWSFLNTEGRRLFGDIPFVVWSSSAPSVKSPDTLFLTPNIRRAIKKTIDIGFRQNTDADTVYLVTSDYSSSVKYEEYVNEVIKNYHDKKLVVIKNFTFDELYSKVSVLPPDGFILFQLVFSDRNNVFQIPRKVADEIVARSSIPVYAFYSNLMGTGMAGGQMIDAAMIARNMVKAAVDMSGGYTVQVENMHMSRQYVDWGAVKKYGLNFDADNTEAVVLNKPVSVFSQYKKEIITIAVAMGIMAVLIVVLIALTMRLKKANRALVTQKSIIVKQSKMAGMGEMLEVIAHRWIQPLNTLSLFHSMLEESGVLKNADDPILAKTHNAVIQSLSEIGEAMDDFTSFFDPEKVLAEFKLRKVFDESMIMVGKVLRKTVISFDDKNDISVVSYEKELKQIVINIILNAKDAFEERKIHDGRIEITLSENTGDNTVRISIADNAGGVDEDLLPNIFDPLFTTKGAKKSGFGLYLVRLILEDNLKGSICAFNNGKGMTFEIIIPKKLT